MIDKMARTNVEPMATFTDGSALLISTNYLGESVFRCELYLSPLQKVDDSLQLRMISHYLLEARTCLEAQEKAYLCAMTLYPEVGPAMKRPPYLIWSGPAIYRQT
jgi:hypothetical protein